MGRRLRILVLAANPRGTTQLRLDEEAREIEAGLRRSNLRARFEVRHQLAVRPRDMRRALLDLTPDIVHFSGHGAGEEGLVLEDDQAHLAVVPTDGLASLFELFAGTLKCVVLNACYSEVQARAIAQHIDYVIGMRREFGDRAAIEFAVGFYDALGAGRPIESAYKFGCNAIRIVGLDEQSTPILLKSLDASSLPTPQVPKPQRPAPRTSPTRSEILAVRSLKELEANGWNLDKLIQHLLSMDFETIGGLDRTSAGNLEQWRPVVENNPDGFAFLLDGKGDIVGYWHFVALQEELFAKAMRGELEDEDITVDRMHFLFVPGVYDLYFVVMAILPKYRGYRANRLLFDALIDRLQELCEAGVLIGCVCANAFTPAGVGLCRSVGMKYVGPHQRTGHIYSLSLREAQSLLQGRPALLQKLMQAVERTTD